MLTLKKVKELVEAPSHAKRTPSPKMLFEEGIVLLRREFDQGSHLTVYNSGYVLFSAGKRNTVFHIHDCQGDYAYDAAEGKGDVIEEEYFENCEWHIHGLIDKMLADLRQIPTVAAAPHHNKISVGSCPVCGNPVHESKLSFCCADRSCKFALWKESRYLSNMRKTLDKKMAVDLLKKGRTHVKDFYSAKKDKTFAADLVMRVEDGRAQYSLEFPKTPMQTKT